MKAKIFQLFSTFCRAPQALSDLTRRVTLGLAVNRYFLNFISTQIDQNFNFSYYFFSFSVVFY